MNQILAALIFALLLTACDSKKPENRSSSTLKMIQRLTTIINNTDPMTSRFMNNEKLLILESITPLNVNQENLQAINVLANEHLNAGNSETASELFSKIVQFMQSIKHQYTKEQVKKITTKLIISYMRMGEQSNCVMLNTNSSCIFPLDQQAIHLNQEGSKKAIYHLEILLKNNPNDLTLKWLYTIAKQTIGEYPDLKNSQWLINLENFQTEKKSPSFKNIAPKTNAAINDIAGGVIMDDFNNDGFIDILASSWGTKGQLKILINDKLGSYIDTSETSGLDGLLGGLNIISADYDNDGDLDVFVLRGAWLMENGRLPNSLLMNDGKGYFTDVTEASNLLSFRPTQTAVWSDFNNDGWLDLFVGNESFGYTEHESEFYKNNQDGTFTNITNQLNLNIKGYIKGATWGDYDNDGKQDLYLSLMDKPNILLRNESTKNTIKFTDKTRKAGVEKPQFSFPTWFWDFNNDGWLDIFVGDYNLNAYISNETDGQISEVINSIISNKASFSSPKIYLNNTNGTYTDATDAMNLNKPLLAMGANFGDIDNDGYLDMYIGTGDPDFKTLIPNRMFKNINGKIFEEVTTSALVGHLQKGHGISFADIDNDGDQDIYAVMGGAFSGDFYPNALFENSGNSNNWIILRLQGVQSNRSAIGARVELVLGKEKSIHRVVGTGGSFGANSLQLEVGLGKVDAIQSIIIQWPSGIIDRIYDVSVNQMIKIIENSEKLIKIDL